MLLLVTQLKIFVCVAAVDFRAGLERACTAMDPSPRTDVAREIGKKAASHY